MAAVSHILRRSTQWLNPPLTALRGPKELHRSEVAKGSASMFPGASVLHPDPQEL